MTAPVVSFRVYPEPTSRLYVTVHLLRTRGDLRALAAQAGPERRGFFKRAIGVSQTWRETTDREIGQVLLSLRNLTHEVLVHESAHALLGWAARRHVRVDRVNGMVTDDEERYCYAQGRCVAQMIAALARRGFTVETPIPSRRRRVRRGKATEPGRA